MKKIAILAMVFIGLQMNAQDKKRHNDRDGRHDRMAMMQDLSAEEMATLKTKKMTLQLDLSASQQAQVKTLVLEEAKLKKTKMAAMKAKKEADKAERPSKEERLKMMNERLDHQIAMKRKMKDILNDEQYARWEKSTAKRFGKRNHKGKRHRSKRK